jgi:hypothetical protein
VTIVDSRIQQVLMTRYNLPIPGRKENLNGAWLDHRHQLFEKYCVPSVRRQTNQNFRWLVLLDSRTPADHLTDVRDALPPNAEITLLSAPIDDTPMEMIFHQARVAPDTPLLTCRLDSDDCLGRDYMRLIRKAAEKAVATDGAANRTAFNFPFGLQLRAGEVFGLLDFDNPFLSLLEAPHSRLSVLAVSHRNIRSVARVKQIKSSPQWLQVVHGGNLDNTIRGLRVPQRTLRHSFEHLMADGLPPESRADFATGAARSAATLVAHAGRKASKKVIRR